LLKLEGRLKEERKQRDLVMLQKPKTIVELILLTLKHGEDDFIDGIEGKVYVQMFNSFLLQLTELTRAPYGSKAFQ
jgi:hypothetical protein